VACGAGLRWEPFGATGEDVHTGVLDCVGRDCGEWYPIVRGIPRMLAIELREAATRAFIAEAGSRLGTRRMPLPARSTDPLGDLKRHTMRNFGFEWIEYARFGWDDPVHHLDYEQAVFRRKALVAAGELEGKLVLDAGCGNGRYSYWAGRDGARVIGIDLGDGVESAGENTRALANVQIVQTDIFRLPFAGRTFDAVFSIGVLMHTGNAKLAIGALAKSVKPGGTLAVHLYGKGNWVYEVVDRTLRAGTTRMSIDRLMRLTRGLFRARQALERIGLATFVNRFVRLGPHPHIIFDWYAAPVATHHTYREVRGWFDEFGIAVTKTNEVAPASVVRRLLRPLVGLPDVVTIRGAVTG
jgi:SAM-dependent methyltransferase/uncharacterized protein YbaR (Trm112 family)